MYHLTLNCLLMGHIVKLTCSANRTITASTGELLFPDTTLLVIIKTCSKNLVMNRIDWIIFRQLMDKVMWPDWFMDLNPLLLPGLTMPNRTLDLQLQLLKFSNLKLILLDQYKTWCFHAQQARRWRPPRRRPTEGRFCSEGHNFLKVHSQKKKKKNLIITVIRMQTAHRFFPACQSRGVGTGSQTMAAAQYYTAGFLCALQH